VSLSLSTYCGHCSTTLSPAFGILYIYYGHNTLANHDQELSTPLATVYYVGTLANTAASTGLITYRVFAMTGKRGLNRYRRVLEAVIESAALYAIVLLVYVPIVSDTNPSTFLPSFITQSIVIPVSVSPRTLIVSGIVL
jgi:hypothetical protein